MKSLATSELRNGTWIVKSRNWDKRHGSPPDGKSAPKLPKIPSYTFYKECILQEKGACFVRKRLWKFVFVS